MSEEQQYLSIKQIADSLGVNKLRVYRYIKANNINEAYQENGTLLYDETAVKLIISAFEEKGETAETVRETFHNTVKDIAADTVDTLMKQLEEKDKQIEQLTAALQSAQETQQQLATALQSAQETQQQLATALNAAQALHAGTIQGQLKEKTEAPESGSDPLEEEPPPKPSFFGRLFGRK